MIPWPELYVLRHGETEWNAAGRHQGRLDSPLTDRGRAQAARQGEILRAAGLGEREIACVCSPQGRAVATAEIALAPLGRTATPDNRLMEIRFGAWEGLTRDEIDARWPAEHETGTDFDWHFSAPGGEPFEEVRDRVAGFLDALDGPAVLVMHGMTSRVLRGLWLGLDRDGTADLPGGQGIVYHMRDGAMTRLG